MKERNGPKRSILKKNYGTKTGRPTNRYKWAETWAYNHVQPIAGLDVNSPAISFGPLIGRVNQLPKLRQKKRSLIVRKVNWS